MELVRDDISAVDGLPGFTGFEFPRGDRILLRPDADAALFGLLLQLEPFQAFRTLAGSSLEPGQPGLHQFSAQVLAIHDNYSNRPGIAILFQGSELDHFVEYERCREILCIPEEILVPYGTFHAVDPDLFLLSIVQDGCSVAG